MSHGKRLTAIAVALALGIAACGDDDDSGGGSSGSANASGDRPAWCGDEEIVLGLADGFGDNTWRRIVNAEARDEIAKCPSVTKLVYTDGQGDTQKAISDINSQIAQGVKALIVFPDAGKAVLPALRKAHEAGVVTVPYRSSPGGKAGEDYTAFVSTDSKQYGELWGEWLVERLDGKGNILYLGGPAGNEQSLSRLAGLKSVIDQHPDMKLIGQQPFNVTNWDPAKTQQVLTSALAKYPQIDAIAADFGAALASSFPAFEQAGREIPPVVTEDSNQLACDWEKLRKDNPDFDLYTNSSQTWMVRIPVQYAVAKATGGTPPSQLSVQNSAFEDSVSGKPTKPKCDPSLPGDAILSSKLSKPKLEEAIG